MIRYPITFALIILLNVVSIGHLFARTYNQQAIDSMRAALLTANEDTNKVHLLCALVDANAVSNYTDGLHYGKQALALARRLKSQKVIAMSLGSLSYLFFQQQHYREAEEYVSQAIGAALKSKDEWLTGGLNGLRYRVYQSQRKYFGLIELYEQDIKKGVEEGDHIRVENAYYFLATLYAELNEYSKAIGYLQKALSVLTSTGDTALSEQALILSELAVFYQRLKQYDQAIEYSLRGIQIAKQSNYRWVETNMHGNLALVYTGLKQFPLAISHGFQSLDMAKAMGDTNLLATALLEIGDAYLLMAKDTNKSKKPLQIASKDSVGRASRTALIPGDRAGRLWLAIDYLEQALSMKQTIGDIEMVQHLYRDLAEAHRMHGDYAAALAYQLTATELKDSLAKKEHQADVESKLMQRDFEKKQSKANAELRVQKTMRNAFIIGFAIMLLFAGVFFQQRNKIRTGKKQSDELLLNILPSEVAEELKDTGASKAKNFNEATVMFTDFKDFTYISEKMSAEDLVKEIDTCFSAFDHIIQRYGVEKIKTIGDAYMCAGGLPVANETHAENVVQAALEIRDFMDKHNREKLSKDELAFEIRIGIHTGPVVAGIVGVKKFAYDIWGDTVNLASRMESSGEAGKVNISASTYALVKEKFNCIARGKIMTKSKGEVEMYFVERPVAG